MWGSVEVHFDFSARSVGCMGMCGSWNDKSGSVKVYFAVCH